MGLLAGATVSFVSVLIETIGSGQVPFQVNHQLRCNRLKRIELFAEFDHFTAWHGDCVTILKY